MLKLIIKQANWGILGTVFVFAIGFFVKIYITDIVGVSNWGKYVSAHTFSTALDVFLTFGIPVVIVKFFPEFSFTYLEFILIPVVLYLGFIVLFFKQIKYIITIIR